MSLFQEPTPLDQPFSRALATLKQELSIVLAGFFYTFEQEGKSKNSMSRLLRLNEAMMMMRAKEIGGAIYDHTRVLIEACSNYANGQGRLERVHSHMKTLQDDLRS